MKNNGAVVAIGFVLLLTVIGAFAFRGQSSETVGQPDTNDIQVGEASEQIAVVYDGKAYSPNQISIQEGATVIFVNESSSPMWPASDPHPLHTDYSDFDPMGPVAAGDSYEYTFREAGEYGFHDHINPSASGVIVVNR